MGRVKIHDRSSVGHPFDDGEVEAFVETFLDADVPLVIVFDDAERGKSSVRGRAVNAFGHHTVFIFLETIARSLEQLLPVGGNVTVASNMREAALFVLAHELRHVWQSCSQSSNKAFWRGKYRRRPCEVDARRFVDLNESNILVFLGAEVTGRTRPYTIDVSEEISSIVSILAEAGHVSDEELAAELSASGLNNSSSLKLARSMLSEILDGEAEPLVA